MAKKQNTVAVVSGIVGPIAESMGYRIWDVRFLKEGAEWYLRIFIDKDGGVDIDDCVDFTHAVNGPLDEADPIEQAYMLEVSSPGLERELKRDEHFEAYVGKKIKLRTIRPQNGERDFAGTLKSADSASFVLLTDDGNETEFVKKECAYVKADDFDF